MIEFRCVYLLTSIPESAREIVTGVFSKNGEVLYLSSGEPHQKFGELKETEDGFELVDKIHRAEDGSPVIWKFEVFTLKHLDAMRASINCFAQLRKELVSEDLLQNFYLENFLPEYWEERYGPKGSRT